jgi:60 kDa SS-A/Ro ribonucleoprotein
MTDYLTQQGGRLQTPQSRPMRSDQTENSAGGFVWKVDPFVRLERFLILGSEGGSYYASESDLTFENIQCIEECLDAHARKTIELIVDVSVDGRAAKQEPTLYALARAASHPSNASRRLALKHLPDVCRTATQLFIFLNYLKLNRGYGSRGVKRALAAWYGAEDRIAADVANEGVAERVAYQAVKYRNREGWTHKRLLQIAHPRLGFPPRDPHLNGVYRWILGKDIPPELRAELPVVIHGFEALQHVSNTTQATKIIRECRLTHEMVPDELKRQPAIWQALYESMPMTALIRNLATMTRIGAIKPMTPMVNSVCERLTDASALQKARVHPIALLNALRTYSSGESLRGDSRWNPIQEIVDALEEAFYGSFKFIEPTGKRMMLAIDVSGSMWGSQGGFSNVAGMPNLAPIEAAACMAMVQARVGDPYLLTAFAGGWGTPELIQLRLTAKSRLNDVIAEMDRVGGGGTDASIPVASALANDLAVDCFALYTDSESWAGVIHPQQALEEYRRKTWIDSRLVAISLVANPYSIADPNDPRTLDVTGFDTAAPQVISDFVAEKI